MQNKDATENEIIEAEYHEIKNTEMIKLDGFGEKEAKEMRPVLQRFLSSYAKKREDVSTESWLCGCLRQELPERPENEITEMSHSIIANVAEFDQNMASLNDVCGKGKTKEDWFCDSVQKASSGMSVNDYGNYLAGIDKALSAGNTQMMRAVTTQDGAISQCFNLDGFIAEQHHVNTFNAKAALENQSYRAEVLAPDEGETYGLNSFDVAIKDIKSGKIIHQYQFKFGKTAEATINLLKGGSYNNQRFVVPEEQVVNVQGAFPGKSVSGSIGGTKEVPTISESMSKEQAKEYQWKVQEKSRIQKMDWNRYSTRDLAIHLGKNAALAGLGGAAIATGVHLAWKAVQGEKIDGEKVVKVAITTGADSGIKAATAGALKVCVEKGMVPILVKGTPIGVIGSIACIAIENIKTMHKFAKGELSAVQTLDAMGRTTVAAVYGLGWGATGAAMGAAACLFIPVVGTFVGGVIGGLVGYMAGSKVGSAIYSGVKKIAKVATSTAKSVYNGIKSIGSSMCSGVKSFCSSLLG